MKKIIYAVQRFRPDLEATSKEINVLRQHFKGSFVFNLHLDGYFNIKLNKKIFSHHLIYYPLSLPFLYLRANHNLIHIYTNIADRLYLPIFKSKNTIISSTNYISKEKMLPRIKDINKVKKIIIQSEVQKKEILEMGINKEKISLIYPPTDLNCFFYQKPAEDFVILCASTPAKICDLEKRGIFLVLSIGARLKDIKIKFLSRGIRLVEEKINSYKLKKIQVDNNLYVNMNEQYARVHCTIIPYLQLDGHLKLIPTSAIESLAAGKPVLVSSETGIASIIKKERCGVVFQPNADSLLNAIEEVKKNYQKYQKNCRRTAEKYFSQEKFIEEHKKIYEKGSQQ